MSILAAIETVIAVLTEVNTVLTAIEGSGVHFPASIQADITALQGKLSEALALIHGVGL